MKYTKVVSSETKYKCASLKAHCDYEQDYQELQERGFSFSKSDRRAELFSEKPYFYEVYWQLEGPKREEAKK